MQTVAESLFGTMEKVSFRRDNLTLAGATFLSLPTLTTRNYIQR
jgi:hypothetical protein